jgi:hypothetical protein
MYLSHMLEEKGHFHFHFRFARTKVLGIIINPLDIGRQVNEESSCVKTNEKLQNNMRA